MKSYLFVLLAMLLALGCSDDLKSSGGGDADSDTDSDTDTDTDTDADTDADSDADSDTDTDADSDSDVDECADIDWSVDVKTINMLVLLDRSASMHDNDIDANTYAEVVQSAIESVVQSNIDAGVINFALNVFPSAENCTDDYRQLPANQRDAMIQCEAASEYDGSDAYSAPEVPFQDNVTMDTYTLISDALTAVGQCGGTPISASLAWASQYLGDSGLVPEDTFVLLATDGAPNCNDTLDIETCETTWFDGNGTPLDPVSPLQCLDDQDSYDEVTGLALAGYETFVIGVGEDVAAFSEVMDGLAYRGQAEQAVEEVPPSDEPYYYPAENAETLNAALENITNLVVDCEYEVDWSGVPDEFGGVEVSKTCADVNLFGTQETGAEVPIGYIEDCAALEPDENGWFWVETPGVPFAEIEALGTDYASCANVQLCPATCAKLKSDGGMREWSGISATFGCESIVIPVLE